MTPQKYMDAFRQGRYDIALSLQRYVADEAALEKRDAMPQELGMDNILPMMINYLLRSDFDDNDLEHLGKLTGLELKGAASASRVQVYSAMSFILSLTTEQRGILRQAPDSDIIPGTIIDCIEIKTPPNNNIDKMNLISTANDEAGNFWNYAKEIKKPIYDETARWNKDNPTKTQDNVYSYSIMRTRNLLKKVNTYRDYLESKLKKADYIVLTNGAPVAPNAEPITSKTKKLETRYLAMKGLSEHLQQKCEKIDDMISEKEPWCLDDTSLNKEDLEKAEEAVATCKENSPSWEERDLLQKITDCLTFGVKAAIRFFNSQERSSRKELDTIIQNDSRGLSK